MIFSFLRFLFVAVYCIVHAALNLMETLLFLHPVLRLEVCSVASGSQTHIYYQTVFDSTVQFVTVLGVFSN